ncbi:hypothetical protein GCM10023210_39250 [Chryseobacterium ginsengisoli]|uniref:Uncharacterized protein n=1 Tax=Chryseobacterium ginsengisoli TaxID=363853 RepID=A0ABP9MV05_9FLAO
MVHPEKEENKIKKVVFENLLIITCLLLLLYTLVYQIYLVEIVEFVKFGHELGVLSYNLSLSIISSGIFYYLVVYIPEKRKKRKVRQVINMRFEQIESQCLFTFRDIQKYSPQKQLIVEFPKNVEGFLLLCNNMKLNSKPPDYWAGSSMVPLDNWYEYFKYNFRYDDKNLGELYKYSEYLEPETMQLMHDLSSHPIRSAINQYHSSYETENYAKEFDSLAHVLYDYLITLSKFKQDSWM